MVYRNTNLRVTLVVMTILLLLVSEPYMSGEIHCTGAVYNADSATLLSVSPVNPHRIYFTTAICF